MENQPTNNENLHDNEIVTLDRARFLDRLEPEYEQQWNQMLDSAADLKMGLDEFMLPLWNDESFPQAIRDRAMLLIVGKEHIGEWKGSRAFLGVKFNLNGVETNGEKFKTWLDQALEYGDIIEDCTLYRLSYEYFANGDWNQERFEHTLEQFDPNIVQWVWQEPFDEYAGLAMLPYIDDILNGKSVDKSNTKMRQWAQEKYDLYVQNFILNEEALPPWLQNLSSGVIKNIVQREYKKVESDEILPLNIIAAYEKYFIGFYNGFHFDQHKVARNGSSILKHLGEFSQRAILAYLQSRYQDAIGFHGTLTCEDEDIILSYITKPLPDKFTDFAERMDRLRAEENEARAEWLAKEKEDRKNREAARVIDEQKRKDAEIKLNSAKAAYLAAQGILRTARIKTTNDRCGC